MFIKMVKSGLLVISDYLPDDAVEITEEEYNLVMHPTKAQQRAAYLLGDHTQSEKKAYLFETLTCPIIDDGSFEEDYRIPFYRGLTIDEMRIEYAKYVGDDEERAAEILSAKGDAKSYIRRFVAQLDDSDGLPF